MKKRFIILPILLFTVTSFSQQIGDGYAPGIGDYTIPLMSGAYTGFNAIGGIPDTSHNWSHILVARHGNPTYNYQLQIASSLAENDRLFFRKIVGGNLSPVNTTWIEIATRGANTFTGNQTFNGSLIVLNSSPKSALETMEVSDSNPLGQAAPTKSVLKLSRNGTPNYTYPENAEFRI